MASLVQTFFQRIMPRAWAEDMERESRLWRVQCQTCGRERSIWEMGGIRWKAYGESRLLRRCPQCDQLRWLRLYKAAS